MPRPNFEPTDAQRRLVKSLVGIGVKQADIAPLVGIRSEKTLRKHFREELDRGQTEANAKVMETLYRMATSGKDVAATLFWLKCRAGWSEKHYFTPSVPPAFVVARGEA